VKGLSVLRENLADSRTWVTPTSGASRSRWIGCPHALPCPGTGWPRRWDDRRYSLVPRTHYGTGNALNRGTGGAGRHGSFTEFLGQHKQVPPTPRVWARAGHRSWSIYRNTWTRRLRTGSGRNRLYEGRARGRLYDLHQFNIKGQIFAGQRVVAVQRDFGVGDVGDLHHEGLIALAHL